MTDYRYTFRVMNLPLERDLQCGSFLLQPIPEGQKELVKRKQFDNEPVVSALGIMPLPDKNDGQARRMYIRAQPLNEVLLLLSFATRRFVEMIDPQIEREVDGDWSYAGGDLHFPMTGKPYGDEWYWNHEELQAYIDRCLPILADPRYGRKRGLGLALQLYRTNFQQDFMELRYLKNWIALETLYSRNSADSQILSRSDARRLRQRVQEALEDLTSSGRITHDQRDLMIQKIPELNRPTAATACHAFLLRLFINYPEQAITRGEVEAFIRIRNQITHGGVMNASGDGDYSSQLQHEYARLKSLLERVILAMLEQHPDLMSHSWRMWRMGR